MKLHEIKLLENGMVKPVPRFESVKLILNHGSLSSPVKHIETQATALAKENKRTLYYVTHYGKREEKMDLYALHADPTQLTDKSEEQKLVLEELEGYAVVEDGDGPLERLSYYDVSSYEGWLRGKDLGRTRYETQEAMEAWNQEFSMEGDAKPGAIAAFLKILEDDSN